MEGIYLGAGWEGGTQDTAGDIAGGLRGTALGRKWSREGRTIHSSLQAGGSIHGGVDSKVCLLIPAQRFSKIKLASQHFKNQEIAQKNPGFF